jgi:hypothetical protein
MPLTGTPTDIALVILFYYPHPVMAMLPWYFLVSRRATALHSVVRMELGGLS